MPHKHMRYRSVGNSGLRVSVVGLGGNNFGRKDSPTETVDGSRPIIEAALQAGITFFDTADSYGMRPGLSEEILGECLHDMRDNVIIATKFGTSLSGWNGQDWGALGSRRYIHRAVEASLRRLNTDWIDLYQYHWPDQVTPIEETLAALDEIVEQGKVRYIGCSNFAAWQVVQADCVAQAQNSVRFISAQNNYNLLEREVEAELTPACLTYGIGIIPYFPLANGLLTGKFRAGQAPSAETRIGRNKQDLFARADWERLEALRKFAEQRGLSMVDIAIGGLAAQPAVASVIAGATSVEQVTSNASAAMWEPTAEDIAELNDITQLP